MRAPVAAGAACVRLRSSRSKLMRLHLTKQRLLLFCDCCEAEAGALSCYKGQKLLRIREFLPS